MMMPLTVRSSKICKSNSKGGHDKFCLEYLGFEVFTEHLDRHTQKEFLSASLGFVVKGSASQEIII